MYVVEHIDHAAEDCLMHELVRRLVVRRLREFDRVWETANRICDQYEGEKGS